MEIVFDILAVIWDEEMTDLYDCRMRPWFVEAASSPKDVIILVDRSGSMTGMRREIARHVVNNILETLGNNDYVNILTFSNTTDPLVECFDNLLVQVVFKRLLSMITNLTYFIVFLFLGKFGKHTIVKGDYDVV